jgi:hypothetical protein
MSGKASGDGDGSKNMADLWIGSVTNVSTFLAGFSLASAVVIADGPEHFRWPGVAVLALTIASVVLIWAVQESRHGARYYEKYSERSRHVIWVAYHVGIIGLLVGLGAARAPRDGVGGQQGLRWAAACVAFSAALGDGAIAVKALVKPDPGTSKGEGLSALVVVDAVAPVVIRAAGESGLAPEGRRRGKRRGGCPAGVVRLRRGGRYGLRSAVGRAGRPGLGGSQRTAGSPWGP